MATNKYYHSPFYYGLIVWRRRTRNVVSMLIALLLLHGREAPAVGDMWFWTGLLFGALFVVCYLKQWDYETKLLGAMGPLDTNTIILDSNFERLERKHAIWYRKKFGSDAPKTNTWSNS